MLNWKFSIFDEEPGITRDEHQKRHRHAEEMYNFYSFLVNNNLTVTREEFDFLCTRGRFPGSSWGDLLDKIEARLGR